MPAKKKRTSSKKAPETTGQKILSWSWRAALAGSVALAVWLVWLDAQVRAQFDGNKWTLPAKVYARPLNLYPGLLISPEQLQAEMKWNDYKPTSSAASPGTYAREGDDWIIHRRAFSFADRKEASEVIRVSFRYGRIATVVVDGQEQGIARLEPQYIGGIFPSHNEDRELISLDEVPPELIAALVAVEDRAFFAHHGISFRGILRAMKANLSAGRAVQGGSTLTQQLVKNLFLSNERTLSRKIPEAFMALLLELHYSKEEILQAYLNEVYLGQAGRRSVHGIALASRFYFGKDVRQLSLDEIAMLVGMIKGPSYYNPFRNPERARERRDVVLGVMEELAIITPALRIRAQGVKTQVASSSRAGQREYPAFIELVKKQLMQDYRLQDLQNEGLRIFTTLDPWLQHAAEQSVQSHLKKLNSGQHKDGPEAAVVVTSADGAEVRALIGSRRVRYFGFNRALEARRPIGSLAKPAVYLTALRSGRYQWASVINDKSVKIAGQNGKIWQPLNYDKKDHGPVLMSDALARSLNQATARLGMKVGLGQVADTFSALGVDKKIPPYPSILLGSLALTPLEAAAMFQTYASGGFVMKPRAIEAVTTAQGQVLTSYGLEGEQKFSPEMMELLRYGLQQVVVKGTGKRLARTFNTTQIAAKTGTSNDQRDAWFAGFDDRYLGVVWVGRDDNKPMQYTGASAALPVWEGIFRQAGVEPLTPLAGLEWGFVNSDGKAVTEDCAGAIRIPYTPGKVPDAVISCGSDPAEGDTDESNDSESSNNEGSGSWFDWLF